MVGLLSGQCIAQSSVSDPILINNNITTFNPGFIGLENAANAQVHYQSFIGSQRTFKTTFVNTHLQIGEQYFAGISATSDIQKGFSYQSSIGLVYSFQLFKTKKHALLAGTNAGVMNYLLLPTPYTGGISSWGVDVDLGIVYMKNRSSIGLSTTNVFKPEFEIFNGIKNTTRSVHLFLRNNAELSPHSNLKSTILFTVNGENSFESTGQFEINYTAFSGLVGYDTFLRSVSFGGGLNQKLEKQYYSIYFMYLRGLQRVAHYRFSRYEIVLRFYII